MSVEGMQKIFRDVYDGRAERCYLTNRERERWIEDMTARILAHTPKEQEDIRILFECLLKVAAEGKRQRGEVS